MDDIEVVEIASAKPRRLRFTPVRFNDRDYSELTLREPTAGDLLESQKKAMAFEQGLALIQRVTDLPLQVVYQLPQGVIEAAVEYFEAFAKPSPGTASAT